MFIFFSIFFVGLEIVLAKIVPKSQNNRKFLEFLAKNYRFWGPWWQID